MAYEVDAPKYVRLAQTVQRRIEAGTYPPGTRVPSENQLVHEFGMSRPTVVRALELLKRDGWLESRQGYGTIVRGRPTVVEGHGRRGLVTLARNESQAAGRLVVVDRVPAPARIALALELPEQTDVLLRRFLVEEGGEAAELVSSYFLTRLADGTELVNVEPMHRGLREYLGARLKVHLDHVTERISTRLPDASEAELLGLSINTPALNVLIIARDASGQVLMASDLLFPAAKQELEHTYRLD
ncbi:GntR family transcriptional regulator [Streptomyces xylophagus]|uniref:GntR family transcriptional regulator n=1 Tax=Streptomyces xylophagus TaxID=285514 RepID=UPI0005B850FE|nr:GntR family transcriptional regulator [Streptomyces xylophagus]